MGVPRRLNSWEVAEHEEQVHEPEAEPERGDGPKLNQEQDQTRRQKHSGVTQQPEAVGSPGMQCPFAVTHPSTKRTSVVVQRRENEGEGRDPHRNQHGLEQERINPAALKPRVQKEQHESEDRDIRRGKRVRTGDINCGQIFSH